MRTGGTGSEHTLLGCEFLFKLTRLQSIHTSFHVICLVETISKFNFDFFYYISFVKQFLLYKYIRFLGKIRFRQSFTSVTDHDCLIDTNLFNGSNTTCETYRKHPIFMYFFS